MAPNPITQFDVTVKLLQARAIFKNGGRKTANKFYNIEKLVEKRGYLATKHRVRNDISYGNLGEILNSREDPDLIDLSDYEFGEMLLQHQSPIGNCEEMSQLVIRLCSGPGAVRNAFRGMYLATVRDPGDHGFVILSRDGTKPPWPSVREMGFSDDTNFWVIDCWLNIACVARDYPVCVTNKLQKWAHECKQIGKLTVDADLNNELSDDLEDGTLDQERAKRYIVLQDLEVLDCYYRKCMITSPLSCYSASFAAT